MIYADAENGSRMTIFACRNNGGFALTAIISRGRLRKYSGLDQANQPWLGTN
jgi:hypothetical protein